MKFSRTFLVMILAAALNAVARAEIYESKDAEGKPVFTDTPTADAIKVDLSQENIADAVKVPADTSAGEVPAQGATSTEQHKTGHDNVVVVPNERNERLEGALESARPHEVLEAEKPYEVGDNPSAEELQRREQAREGVYVDEKGNTVRVQHRGHVGR